MYSSAELIEALRRRLRRSLRPERPPGEFPPGWAEWFAAMVAVSTKPAVTAIFRIRASQKI